MAQREKRHRINLSVTEEESEKIDEMAMKTGYATAKQSGAARYVKRLALGYTPKSIFDKKVIVEIGRLHTDLGRVGGLIKKAIEDGAVDRDLYSHIGELLSVRREIMALVTDIRDGKFNEKHW